MHGGTIVERARPRGGDAGAHARARRSGTSESRRARGGAGERSTAGATGLLRRTRASFRPRSRCCAPARACVVAAPSFFAAGNLRDLALNNAPVLLVALGMTLVILVGEIDISVGSQFAVCSVAAGVLAKAGVPIAARAAAPCSSSARRWAR